MNGILKESDLASFAIDWLRNDGYDTRSEVHHVDIIGRDASGLFHAVELKKHFNVDVISQALRGQRWAGQSTIFVPYPHGSGAVVSRKITEWIRICRGLSLGLCLVKPGRNGEDMTVVSKVIAIRTSDGRADMRKEFEKQFAGRSQDHNVAGRPGTRLYTAFSEKAIRIARWLIDEALRTGSLAPCHCSDIASGSGYADARRLMYAGFKEYFSRTARGCMDSARGLSMMLRRLS